MSVLIVIEIISKPTANNVALLHLQAIGANSAVEAGNTVPAVPVKVPETVTLLLKLVTVYLTVLLDKGEANIHNCHIVLVKVGAPKVVPKAIAV